MSNDDRAVILEKLALASRVADEEVTPGVSDYEDFQEVYTQIGRFIDDVARRMRQRTLRDSSLGWLTPAEFKQQWDEQQPQDVSAARLKIRRFCVQYFH